MINLKMYLVSQNDVSGYDTYDSMVVSAESEQEAREMLPTEYSAHSGSWTTNLDKIDVEFIGVTNQEKGVILSSFNAG